MALDLFGLFNPRANLSAAHAGVNDSERRAMRGVTAAVGSRGVNPAAQAAALASAQTDQRAAGASLLQRARVADEQAKMASIQSLVGTGLSLAGTIGSMGIGGAAGGVGDKVMAPAKGGVPAAGQVSQASQPIAATGSVSPGGTHPVVTPTVSPTETLPMPLTPRAEGTGPGISNEALQRIVGGPGPAPAAQPSPQDTSALNSAMSIIGNMGGLDPSSTEEMQRRQNLLWGPGGSYNRIWGR